MPNAFDLLAEPIRHVLWDMRWTELRPIQEDAIHAVLESDDDLILSARTASGKTEAAFLPVLSHIHAAPHASVRAIYVGPLKALINDQFRRLEDLCIHARIPVHRWHGDVAASKKRSVLQRPSGVLLITPESLESLFVNHSAALRHLFHSLSFVVIDELHALHGTERGTHLRSLLFRLDQFVVKAPRLLALSATLGDPARSARWLRPDEPHRVRMLNDTASQKGVRFGIFAYEHTRGTPGVQPSDHEDPANSDVTPPAAMTRDLYEAFRTERGLIFANSRSNVEWYADALNELAAADGRTGQFLVHHGSLSKDVREHTEELMQGRRPYTTVCTSSLELGIDIGNVAAVGQIESPFSVSSLVQRLGRSGRRDEQPQCMRQCLLEERLAAEASLCARLRPSLLQAIALTELMLQKWVEPPDETDGDLSTLIQQILSVTRETGGVRAVELYRRLVTDGAFRYVEQPIFLDVLRSMSQHDLIEQAPDGVLILGLKGEQIVGHYDFYSAFASSDEYRVVHQGTRLGSLPASSVPPVGHHFLLAGRRWQIVGIDHDRREIVVRPGYGRNAPLFQGGGGSVHSRVRQTMRDVLTSDRELSYLNDHAAQLLRQARAVVRDAGLDRRNIVPLSPTRLLWFTWTGTSVQATLQLLARRCRLDATDHEIALEFNVSLNDLREAFFVCLRQMPNAAALAALEPWKQRRKYDSFLSDELLDWSFAREVVDLSSARELIASLTCG